MLEIIERYEEGSCLPLFEKYESEHGWNVRLWFHIKPGAIDLPDFQILADLVYSLLFVESDGLVDLKQTPAFELKVYLEDGELTYQTGYDLVRGAHSGRLYEEGQVWHASDQPYQIIIDLNKAGPVQAFLAGMSAISESLQQSILLKGYFKYILDPSFQELLFWVPDQPAFVIRSLEVPDGNWVPGVYAEGAPESDDFFFYGRVYDDQRWIKALPCLMQIAAFNEMPGKDDRSLVQKTTSTADEESAVTQIDERYFNFSSNFRVQPAHKERLLKSMQKAVDCLWQSPRDECFGLINQIIFSDPVQFVLESWKLNVETGKLEVYHTRPMVHLK